ncbi:hypothetical protein N7468_004177 [Penicillium chermesinum]|uniref:Ubiquitin-like protease family profile domain-containing protein n=1 Tax=Penicillium chermesinum TaxID=63820 RepID=A0A9W9TSY2_9EURO|nr:uncharacterized protein N7468_004177 [Penicillium chermesinum]KAJ5239558.1 hypothetical protein N7468_004177 [Penicillium chermesinum]KAJ6141192.1 hypothetical protein N7470_010088 [Penicillium chermesinum]
MAPPENLQAISLLKKFIQFVISSNVNNIQEIPEFWDITRELVQKDPNTANAVREALTEPSKRPLPRRSTARRRRRRDELSYRPPYTSRSSARRGSNFDAHPKQPDKHADIRDQSVMPGVEAQPAEESTKQAKQAEHIAQTPTPSSLQYGSNFDAYPPQPGKHADMEDQNITPSIQAQSAEESTKLAKEAEHNAQTSTPSSNFQDFAFQVTQSLWHIKLFQEEVPSAFHQSILRSLAKRDDEQSPALQHWSDGSMFVRVIEASAASQKRRKVLNMLEYIWAYEWHQDQVDRARNETFTKRRKPISDRTAAGRVLDAIQKPAIPGYISKREKDLQRGRIEKQLLRGKILSTKLVKELGLGILFSPEIWDYIKLSSKELDQLIHDFRNNYQFMILFEALSKQLYIFVEQGCPDLRQFFLDLKSSGALDVADLVSMERMETEYADLPAQKNYWNDKLERALADLECYIKVSILAKPKGASFEQDDAIYILNNEISCEDLQRLNGKWLTSLLIFAIMGVTDRPGWVSFGYSIQIDQTDNPFKRCAEDISSRRERGQEPLVYFRPLNHQNSHFTLLEINEKDRMVRHYDSLPVKENRDLVMQKAQHGLGHMGFQFEEAVCLVPSE